MPPLDLQTIVDTLVRLAYIALPVIAAWIGVAVRSYVASHASIAQQQQLSLLAFSAVSAAEQACKGQAGARRFAAADLSLRTLAPKLTDVERSTLIHAGVRALNAGAIALAPNTAALLTPETTSAAPGVDVQAITDSAAQAASTTINTTAPIAVKSALSDILAPVMPLLTMLTNLTAAAAPATAAAAPTTDSTPIVDTSVSSAAQAPTQTIRVSRTKVTPTPTGVVVTPLDVTATDPSVVPSTPVQG